ncbi:thioredoxin family protein [Cytobacillus purgationiresistens]|uniref:Thiol-disulfide isomerase/thioredoxin n=1 Tax=Cytobacillus purgationiresistens TaxID=863449 RepID=A0ABU0ACM8_9BACI|nr:thioredoxin family protein [Cytobacillus purgationiresistens]MDQ0269003.1 thiol-disulfide isomerase/thioredoxin [Cytobacillus purgationiresistens]
MKKVIIFLAIIILLFAGVGILTKMQNEQKVSGNNPYGKNTLHPETANQLNDPNYSNIILPSDLKDVLADEGDATVYFFSPLCEYCKKATPIVSPLSENMDVNLVQYNLLEFDEGFNDYAIKETPTIIQFKDGKETARITGLQDKAVFENWFNEHSK